MDRSGISTIIGDGDLFGEDTIFRKICNGFTEKVVEEGKWFSFCTKASEKQVNLMGIKNNEGVSLGSMAAEYFPELPYRVAVYKYLMMEFLCYYEAPIVTKDYDSGSFRNSYNKFLVTSNLSVVSKWAGLSYDDTLYKYGSRVYGIDEDVSESIPYFKLYETKDGERKITKTRKDLDLSEHGVRIVPVFALKTGIDYLYSKLTEDCYTIDFCKDSGQERSMNITFNKDILSGIYKDNSYLERAYSDWYKGDFEENPCMERGYIRVFEVGSSVYDYPIRSINYARITGYRKEEPDLAFMYIDIDSVLDTFKDYVNTSSVIAKDINEVVNTLDVFDVGSEREVNNVRISSIHSLILWAEGQAMFGTVFLRSLALFMIANQQWFKGYTGKPKGELDTGNLENELFDDFDDYELDLG